MSETRTLFVETGDVEALVAAVGATFPDGVRVTRTPDSVEFEAPGRAVYVDLEDAALPPQVRAPATAVDVWDPTGGVSVPVEVAAELRAAGFPVVVNPQDPDLVAADRATARRSALTTKATS